MPRRAGGHGTFPRVQKTRVYLSPGMFGFATLASLEYFEHFIRAIEERFRDRGRIVEIHVCEVHPTASILRRAAKLARLVDESAGDDDGPIHIVGHSTGGLDARLVASPTARLPGTLIAGSAGRAGCGPSPPSTRLISAPRSPPSSPR